MANPRLRRFSAPPADAWPPGASSVMSMTTRYYLSESCPAGRKVFFDFAMLPERAKRADSTDSTGCAIRFNDYAKFVASTSRRHPIAESKPARGESPNHHRASPGVRPSPGWGRPR